MTTSTKTRTTIELNPGDTVKLQAIAKQLGYLHSRGPDAGKVGSISALMQAIANNEIKLNLQERIE